MSHVWYHRMGSLIGKTCRLSRRILYIRKDLREHEKHKRKQMRKDEDWKEV